jgi:hypothetical protein
LEGLGRSKELLNNLNGQLANNEQTKVHKRLEFSQFGSLPSSLWALSQKLIIVRTIVKVWGEELKMFGSSG